MNEKIKFSYNLEFKDNIASILSISLEHEENVYQGEIDGEFIIYGEYKVHNDTTNKEEYNFRLPFSTKLLDDINYDTVKVDIVDFTYDIKDNILHVIIEYLVTGDILKEMKKVDDIDFDHISDITLDEEIDRELEDIIRDVEHNEVNILDSDINVTNNIINESNVNEKKDEYVTYHVHVFKDNENIDNVVKSYNGNMDIVLSMNDLKNVKLGDKIIIPEYKDE